MICLLHAAMAFSKLLSLSINSLTNQCNGFSHRHDPQQLRVGSSSLRETNQHIARRHWVGSGTPSRSAPYAVCTHLVIAGVDQSDIPCLSRLTSLIDAASNRAGVTERAVATPAGLSSGFRFTLSITSDVIAAFANPNSIPTVFHRVKNRNAIGALSASTPRAVHSWPKSHEPPSFSNR